MRYAALIVALSGVLAGGCNRQPETGATQQLGSEDYGALPGLKEVPDLKLRDELARLIEQRATPELIGKTAPAEEENVAAGLVRLFPESKIASILDESAKIFPSGKFELDPIRLQRAINFREQHDARQLQARDALGRPQCDFGIRFTDGLTDELKFIDVVRICARLEAFQAAESLAADDPQKAVEALGFMFRLASCLGAEKHPVARLEAGFLRTEAFRVLQAIVEDDQITRKRLDQLSEMVAEQLAIWPDDADAWIGDRALGLYAYEMVRAGNLEDSLTPKEIEQFEKEGILEELLAAAVRNVNRDQLYYLQTMQKIIDSCTQPYHARLSLFDSIGRELQEKRNSPDFPLVAAWVLRLPDVRKGHAIQAQDRANWEAWALALALATEREMPPYQINPLTGQKYRAGKHGDTVEVTNFGSGIDGDRPSIIVPDPGSGD
jgi:hypothetical protein